MEEHEVSEIFPEMSREEFTALHRDIAEKGLLEPIWVHDGKIIDGRHRYRICCGLNIKPEYREWDGEGGTLLGFVVSRNLHRRHLSPGQRAALAAETKPMVEAEIREDLRRKAKLTGAMGGRGREKGFDNNIQTLSGPERNAREEVAAMFDVAPTYVSDAERIREKSPEAFQAVKAGLSSIPEAKRTVARESAPPRPEDHKVNFIRLSLSPDPHEAATILLRYFKNDRLEALIRSLSEGLKAVRHSD